MYKPENFMLTEETNNILASFSIFELLVSGVQLIFQK